MAVRSSHARHQSRDTSFQSEFGDVTLHAGVFVDKSKLYSLKRRILTGKINLDIQTYRHFVLAENGSIEPIIEKWALREQSFQKTDLTQRSFRLESIKSEISRLQSVLRHDNITNEEREIAQDQLASYQEMFQNLIKEILQ